MQQVHEPPRKILREKVVLPNLEVAASSLQSTAPHISPSQPPPPPTYHSVQLPPPPATPVSASPIIRRRADSQHGKFLNILLGCVHMMRFSCDFDAGSCDFLKIHMLIFKKSRETASKSHENRIMWTQPKRMFRNLPC